MLYVVSIISCGLDHYECMVLSCSLSSSSYSYSTTHRALAQYKLCTHIPYENRACNKIYSEGVESKWIQVVSLPLGVCRVHPPFRDDVHGCVWAIKRSCLEPHRMIYIHSLPHLRMRSRGKMPSCLCMSVGKKIKIKTKRGLNWWFFFRVCKPGLWTGLDWTMDWTGLDWPKQLYTDSERHQC